MTVFTQLTTWAGPQLLVVAFASILAAVLIAVTLKRRGTKAVRELVPGAEGGGGSSPPARSRPWPRSSSAPASA